MKTDGFEMDYQEYQKEILICLKTLEWLTIAEDEDIKKHLQKTFDETWEKLCKEIGIDD